MRRQDFSFELPDELIARYPSAQRTGCRLLQLDGKTGAIEHGEFTELLSLLRPNDLLVLNNTRVIPARLFGRKLSGGKVELLVERLLPGGELLAQVGSSKPLREGAVIELYGDSPKDEDAVVGRLTVSGRQQPFYKFKLQDDITLDSLLKVAGHMPLPPYLGRSDEPIDAERYQTVYAQHSGAVAAPTAGLHFDEGMLENLKELGVNTAFITLHVGAATFQPIRVDDLKQHQMHAETLQVSQAVCDAVRQAREQGGRIIAVGSTSVRALETAAQSGKLTPYDGESELFIYPGYEFKCVDALITNFHLSESSLLMMICAFAGRENVLGAYNEAVQQRYQFFSYGDAMFIEPDENAIAGRAA